MSAARKQKAIDYLEGSMQGDKKRMGGGLVENFKLWVPKAATLGNPTPMLGRDYVVNTVTGGAGTVFDNSKMEFTVLHALAEGDYVAIHFRLNTKTKKGGVYDNEYIFLFRFEDELIAEAWEQTDTAYGLAAVGHG